MKLVFLEPLGIPQEKLESIVKQTISTDIEIIYFETRAEDTQTLIERSHDADIVVLSNLPFKEEVIRACPNLKMIAVAFTGVDHVAMDYCKSRGILVCNCAGYSTAAVADLVFGLIISLYRNIIPCNDVVRHEGTKNGLIGFELEGKKFGVIGTGAIGMRTAKIAQAFGCEVYAYSRTVKEEPGIRYTDLSTLLSECDIVSLHVPLNKETKGMIGKDELAKMKETAILINTARGPVVDNEALADALNQGKIAGAGIDVFETEPPIPHSHPLCSAKNTILTPHVAFATKEALEKRAVIVVDNVESYLNGNPIHLM